MSDTYTTRSGDEWDYIAKQELGSERYTSDLMECNPQYIETVVFPAGVILTLPKITTPAPTSLPPWKR